MGRSRGSSYRRRRRSKTLLINNADNLKHGETMKITIEINKKDIDLIDAYFSEENWEAREYLTDDADTLKENIFEKILMKARPNRKKTI